MPIGLFPVVEYERAEMTLGPGRPRSCSTRTGSPRRRTRPATSSASTGCRPSCAVRAEPLVALAVAIETAVEVFADGTPFGDDRTLVMLRREP